MTIKRSLLLLALILFCAFARAQSPIVGAPVLLFSPGPVTATLLAAPSSPDYVWGTQIYWGTPLAPASMGTSGLNTFRDPIGSTATSSPIPAQAGNGLPIVFMLAYVNQSDIPPGGGQPQSDIPNYFVTTGFLPQNNLPAGPKAVISPSAAVVFGPPGSGTAEIGFAPIGMQVGDFADYPIRIAVTNVGAGGLGGCSN